MVLYNEVGTGITVPLEDLAAVILALLVVALVLGLTHKRKEKDNDHPKDPL